MLLTKAAVAIIIYIRIFSLLVKLYLLSHLLNCFPHDVLSGTRMDLGECLKVHDLAIRTDYEIASKEQDFFFELDAMDHLQSFIVDCDRRTEVSKKRLAETQEEISAEVAAKAECVHELNEEIGKLLAKVEQLGAEGNVEESQKVMDEVEKREAEKFIEILCKLPVSSSRNFESVKSVLHI
ncbi:putative RNA-binding protein Luc7-like 2 isoform 1 [Cricetulus griseus]|uniref:Putative RNA-binding protein Luc7-like 2 isoform 1 n=1 Tax=Cricetulus griseus TaxID=10029 RepID=A0A061ID88_CRIGR|nr:putative RNA-binding protein Luc7-like 2 isoform 1 [Cricetulus griseus]